MEENVLVFPNRIRFGVDSHGMLIEEILTISSAWSKTIAFRITPSVGNVLSIPASAGYLPPFQSLRLPVTSLQSVSPESFRASISVDIATAEFGGDDAPSIDVFWKHHMVNFTTRIVSCECCHADEGPASSSKKDSGLKMPPAHSVVHPPTGHILDLMIKNVTKNDPLNPSEKEELKAVRSLMTGEQWASWLAYARSEKKKRMLTSSSSKLSEDLSVEKNRPGFDKKTSQLVDRLLKTNSIMSKKNDDMANSTRSLKDSSAGGDLPESPNASRRKDSPRQYDLTEGIAFANINPAISKMDDRIPLTRSKTPPSMEKNRPTASMNPRANPVRPSSAPRLRGGRIENVPGGVSCSAPLRYDDMKERKDKKSPVKLFSSNFPPPLQEPGHLSRSGGSTKDENHSSSNNNNDSDSIYPDLNMSSSRAAPIQTPFFTQRSAPTPSTRNSSPKCDFDHVPKVRSVSPPKRDPSSPFAHEKSLNQPSMAFSGNYRHQLYHHSLSKKSNSHPPEIVYKPQSAEKPTPKSTQEKFWNPDTFQEDFPVDLKNRRSMSPTAVASAKASALRIDSAYAAAECMKASLKAEGEKSKSKNESSKVATTIAMLDVMMNSLEKSRLSLDDILRFSKEEKDSVMTSEFSEVSSPHESDNRKQHRKTHQERRNNAHDDESDSDDRSSFSRNFDVQSNRIPTSVKNSGCQNGFENQTPEMELLRTQELDNSRSLEDRWNSDNFDQTPHGKFLTSGRGSYESTPMRTYKSTLIDETHNTITKADFNELHRFDNFDSSAAAGIDEIEQSRINGTSSSDNKNVAAAAVARYKNSKSVSSTRNHIPRVWRICLSQGPLLKAFEENPIRFDVENSTVDVVWRDSRTLMNSSGNGDYSYSNSKTSTLRRERFHFNESYAGPGGLGKLCAYARGRVKKSIQSGRGIAFVCVAGGEGNAIHRNSQVEPPVSVVLGECGGQGLISAVTETVFRHAPAVSYPCKQSEKTMHRKYGGKNAPPVLASSVNLTEAANEPVFFSAVVVSDGSIVDLLGPSGSLIYQKGSNNPGRHEKRKCKVSKKSNGRYYISHMTRLRLLSVADFERVAGVLLGRRSALREMVPVLDEMLAATSYSDMIEQDIQVPDTPWLLSSKQEATLLFTVSTKMFNTAMPSVHSQASDLSFFFCCPCGDSWSLPGNELCLLSEGISSLPHAPAPSILQAGVLSKLLLDRDGAELDYVNVAAVIRSDGDDSSSRHNTEQCQKDIQNSLHAFRVVTSDS